MYRKLRHSRKSLSQGIFRFPKQESSSLPDNMKIPLDNVNERDLDTNELSRLTDAVSRSPDLYNNDSSDSFSDTNPNTERQRFLAFIQDPLNVDFEGLRNDLKSDAISTIEGQDVSMSVHRYVKGQREVFVRSRNSKLQRNAKHRPSRQIPRAIIKQYIVISVFIAGIMLTPQLKTYISALQSQYRKPVVQVSNLSYEIVASKFQNMIGASVFSKTNRPTTLKPLGEIIESTPLELMLSGNKKIASVLEDGKWGLNVFMKYPSIIFNNKKILECRMALSEIQWGGGMVNITPTANNKPLGLSEKVTDRKTDIESSKKLINIINTYRSDTEKIAAIEKDLSKYGYKAYSDDNNTGKIIINAKGSGNNEIVTFSAITTSISPNKNHTINNISWKKVVLSNTLSKYEIPINSIDRKNSLVRIIFSAKSSENDNKDINIYFGDISCQNEVR